MTRFLSVESDEPGGAAAVGLPGPPVPSGDNWASAEAAVTALYAASALGLIRMAYVMLGDLPSAEDLVQEAFCGLYRRWDQLSDKENALSYLRSSVLNGCRSELRRRIRNERRATPPAQPAAQHPDPQIAFVILEQAADEIVG